MKLIIYHRFRSEGKGVNKTDDMVRATFDMTANEFKRIRAEIESKEDKEMSNQIKGERNETNRI